MAESRCRIVLRGMGTARRPGNIVAVINDPINLGASTYLNGPGEMFFTLRSTHPQVGSCEPWRTHYDVQEWVSGTWKPRYQGILSDFDANDNDIIVYGIDYLALLDKVIDTRYIAANPDAPTTADPPGSKHVNQKIAAAIINVVDYARFKQYSPVQWIERGPFNTFAEKVTIFSTFSSIREFIAGLVESHKAGTGHRSRFYVERISDTRARFRLVDNVGVDRPGMRLTYGGLVQGFQIIGFGNFGVKAHGIGRTQVGSKLHYKTGAAPGLAPNIWGNIETVAFHDNVVDANDLARRVNLHAANSGRIGKRVALGLKVDGVRPFEGYNIGDNLPVHLKRGAIDTTRYGSAYWTLQGVEWRVYADGHDEVTLVLLPREDKVPPQSDILTAQEVTPPDPVVADGSITTDKLAPDAVTSEKIAPFAVTSTEIAEGAITSFAIADDAVTGDAIADGAVGADEVALGALTAAHFAPGALPGADTTAPAVPTGLNLFSEVAEDSDGHHILRLIAELNQPGDSDLYGSWVEVTNRDDGSGNPDWDYPQTLFIPSTLSAAAIEGIVGNTLYWARAQSADRVGNRSVHTTVVSHTSLRDTDAPPMPDSLTAVAGFKGFAATWPASTAPDLMFNEVRWALDDGTGLAPDINNWAMMRARSSTVFISGLEADRQYWVQVRSVDVSGNVVTNASDPTAVDYLANPDAGWVASVPVTPTLIGSTDIAAESITAVHIEAGSMTADDIRAGTLVIKPEEAWADGIEVRGLGDPGDLLGRWDENGLKVIDPTDPSRYILVDSGQVKMTTDGGTTFDTAITPDGINASAITFGQGPGGHNVVLNSSFELAEFTAAPSTFLFTDTTNWAAAKRLVAPVNLLEGTALTVQTPGYA